MLTRLVLVFFLSLVIGLPASAQWQFDGSGTYPEVTAFGADGSRIAMRCAPVSDRPFGLFIDVDLRSRNNGAFDRSVVLRVGNHQMTLNYEGSGSARNGFVRFRGLFDYDNVVRSWLDRLQAGRSARIESGASFFGTTISLTGSRDAIARMEAACRSGRAAPPPAAGVPRNPTGPLAPPPPAPLASLIPEDALSNLQTYVRDQIAPNCAPSVPLTLNEATMFQVSGADVTVWLNQAQCAWITAANPYCIGGRCAFWVYRYTGGQFQLVRTGSQ